MPTTGVNPAEAPNEFSNAGLMHGARPFHRHSVRAVGVEVLVERQEPNDLGPHRHADWQVVILPPGAAHDVTWSPPSGKTKRRRIIGGDVWMLPPGWLHTSRWREPADVIVLWIDDGRIRRSFGDLPAEASIIQLTEYVAAVPNIVELCRELRQFAGQPNGPVDWRIAAEGCHLATLLLKAHLMLTDGVFRPPSALVGGVLLRLKAHLAEHRHDRVPLGKMARSLGVSDRHLRRIFRDAMGVSPQEWVIVEKVKQAAHLLVEGDSVKATVEKAGFTSDSHLHRAMLRVYGISPSAFRKQAQFAAVPSRG